MTWQLFILTTLIILLATYIMFSESTIYCLLSVISLVLVLSWFLVYAGLELYGFMLSLIYLGAILVFFIFVIMLIDLRFEDLQEVYEEARTYEPQAYAPLLPVLIFLSMIVLNVLVERTLYEEYAGLEFLITPEDLAGLSDLQLSLLKSYFIDHTRSPTAVGFFLYSTEGTSVGVLSLLILFSLYLSLYTVQSANNEVLDRLEAVTLKNAAKQSK